jgi:hypothetical protein
VSDSETIETEAPRRGRPPRVEAEHVERRRRQPGSLNRMVASNLGLPEECLDRETWHYHWVTDKMGRVGNLTMHDDYDVVTMEELEENARRNRVEFALNADSFGTGTLGGLSRPVERDGTKAVLMRKRKSFYDHDCEEQVRARQDMMEAIVYEGDTEALGGAAPDNARGSTLDSGVTYVPRGNTLGDTAPRRRGPIPTRRL